ncbi:hypothetical protein LCGC14_0901790 [marine sediment metagenome]|uniref:Uncharacterized protein n=1 Tax=marine sediment metagenome TaxID=412755 RepID=A0A0F9NW45_9ZZZZ
MSDAMHELVNAHQVANDPPEPPSAEAIRFLTNLAGENLSPDTVIVVRGRIGWLAEKLDAAGLAAVVDERDDLRAIVKRLPLTADGMPVVPLLDKVWHPNYGVWLTVDSSATACTSYDTEPVSACYSTEAKAREASQ